MVKQNSSMCQTKPILWHRQSAKAQNSLHFCAAVPSLSCLQQTSMEPLQSDLYNMKDSNLTNSIDVKAELILYQSCRYHKTSFSPRYQWQCNVNKSATVLRHFSVTPFRLDITEDTY